jgi:hypothetical protein
MAQCVKERPIEIFDIMRRFRTIKLMAGDLDIYRLLASISDEAIIEAFKRQGKKLEITGEQYFYGFSRYHAIGFVRSSDGKLRIFENLSDCLVGVPDDRQIYRTREADTIIFAPASQATESSWVRETIRF